MPNITAIIPARYDSTRFPGKILADQTGKPLIQHVYELARKVASFDRVIVATDDRRIDKAVTGFGGETILTHRDHANGTSRIAEAALTIDADIIVNLQGDEPQLEPSLIELTIQRLLDHPPAPMATLASPFMADEDPADPNIVKVVLDEEGRAISFSRSIENARNNENATPSLPLKHIGLYVYRSDFLQTYINLTPTPREQAERLEQMRVLEHNYTIQVALGEVRHHGIDTPEQYARFVEWYRSQTS